MRRGLLAAAIVATGCFYSVADLREPPGDASGSGGAGGWPDGGGGTGNGQLPDASPDGDPGCPSGKKGCGDYCATIGPEVGCASLGCEPCAVGNATPGCSSSGQCVIASCPAGLGDCDADPENGCETDTSNSAAHCGACNHDCLGGACASSKCQPFVLISETNDADMVAPWSIVADAGQLFITVTNYSSDGRLMRMNVDGSGLTTLANEQEPFDLVVDASHVYWTDNNSSTSGEVLKTPRIGGTTETLADSEAHPVGVSIDASSVYWAAYDQSAIRRVAKSGGTISTLASGQSGARYTVADPGTTGFVYFTTAGDGRVEKVAKGGGTAIALTVSVDSPWGLAADPAGSDLYFTRFTVGGDVLRISKAASSAAPSPVASIDSAMYVHADATHVYFTTHVSGGSVGRVAKAGGSIETLASGLDKPTAVTTDDSAIYWVEYNASKIWKLAK